MASSASSQPPAKGFPLPQLCGGPGVKGQTPVSDCSREGSRFSLYRVSRTKGNTSLSFSFGFSKRHPLTLHLTLRSLKKLRANPPGSFRPQLYDESFQNPNRCCPAPSTAGRVGSLSSGPEKGGSVRAALWAPAVVQLQGEWPVGRKHRVTARGVTSVSYIWQEGITPSCHPSPTPKYCLP